MRHGARLASVYGRLQAQRAPPSHSPSIVNRRSWDERRLACSKSRLLFVSANVSLHSKRSNRVAAPRPIRTS